MARLASKLYLFLPFIVAIFITAYGLFRPAYNWDIIGYVAASHFLTGDKGETLRKNTLNSIRSAVPEKTYVELTSATDYRVAIASDGAAMEEQMPFYTIRMAYLSLMQWLSGLGIPLAQTTFIISSVFAGLCSLLLMVHFPSDRYQLALLFPVILVTSGFPKTATMSTPDTMAALLALLSVFYYEKKQPWALTALFLLPFVRTDFIILAGLISLCALYKRKFVPASLFLLLPLAAYFYVNKVNSNYGYLKILNFTLINNDPHPATMAIETTIGPYLEIYKQGLIKMVTNKHFILYVGYLAAWFKIIRHKNDSTQNERLFIVLGFVGIHMILFPAYYDRFFNWCAAIAGFQIVVAINEVYFKGARHKKLES